MPDPTLPGGAPPPNLEDLLMHRTNDAIASGVDPKAATDQLGQALRFLRANPTAATAATQSLTSGTDPKVVFRNLGRYIQQAGPTIGDQTPHEYGVQSPPEKPGFLNRVGTSLSNTASEIVHHPIDALTSVVTAPVHSALAAFDTPVVGERISGAHAMGGKGGNAPGAPRSLPEGTIITKANTPAAETPAEMNAGALQTVANIAAGPIAGKVSGAAAPYIGNLASRVVGTAATGATVGAAYNPDDPGVGAATGATLGTALHPVGAVLDPALKPALKGVAQLVLPSEAFAPAVDGAADRGARIINKSLAQDNLSPADLAARKAAAHGKPVSVADIAGPNTKELLGTVSRIPSVGKQQVFDAVAARQEGQLGRVKGDVETALGLKDKNVHDVADAIVQRQSDAASPLYNAFRQSGSLAPDASLDAVLQSPIGQRAIRQAQALPQFKGLSPYDPQILDKVYKNIGGKAQKATQSGDGALAHDYNTVRTQLRDAITSQRPGYGDALDAFAGHAELKSALQTGQEFVNKDPRLTAKELESLSPGEREMYRVGALDSIRRILERNDTESGNLVKAIFGNTERRAALENLIGSPDAFAKLQDALDVEKSINKTHAAITGNSATASRTVANQEFDANVGGRGAQAVAGGVLHPVKSLVSYGVGALDRARQGLVGKTATSVGQQLFAGATGNSAEVDAVIQQLIDAASKAPRPKGRLVTPRAGATAQSLKEDQP